MSTGDADADENVKSADDEVSKGQCSSGKQVHICTHNSGLNFKCMCGTCVNEIGVKDLEESTIHDCDAILECNIEGLPNHVKV